MDDEKLETVFNPAATPPDPEIRAFFRAAESNDTRALGKTLDKWPDAARNWRDSSGEAVIPAACNKLNPATLELLLEHGADIDDTGTKERRKWSALQTAAFHGYLEQAEMFLRHGAKTDVLNEYGETPLMYAVQQDKLACADLLVLAGADPDYRGKSFRKTAFDQCTSEEMREVIRFAQKKRADFLASLDSPSPAADKPPEPPSLPSAAGVSPEKPATGGKDSTRKNWFKRLF